MSDSDDSHSRPDMIRESASERTEDHPAPRRL